MSGRRHLSYPGPNARTAPEHRLPAGGLGHPRVGCGDERFGASSVSSAVGYPALGPVDGVRLYAVDGSSLAAQMRGYAPARVRVRLIGLPDHFASIRVLRLR